MLTDKVYLVGFMGTGKTTLATALGTKEPLVRRHAAWALGWLGGDEAEAALVGALADEIDVEVVEELEAALTELSAARHAE